MKQPQFAFYKGTSWISKAIRGFTWGDYSHVAIYFPHDGTVIEAWHHGGVLHNASLGAKHTPGTVVHLHDLPPMTEEQIGKMHRFLLRQLGKGYDFGGVLSHVRRSKESATSRTKLFCSELALSSAHHVKLPILPGADPHKISPVALSWAFPKTPARTVITTKLD